MIDIKNLRVLYRVLCRTLHMVITIATITIVHDCHAFFYYKQQQENARRQVYVAHVEQKQIERYTQVDALLELRNQRLQEREDTKLLAQQQLEQKLFEQCEEAKKREEQKQTSLQPDGDAASSVQLLRETLFGQLCGFEELKANNYTPLTEDAVKCADSTILEFLFHKTGLRYQNPICNSIITHAVNRSQYNVISWLLSKNCFYELWEQAVTQHNSAVMVMLLENRKNIDIRSTSFWVPIFKNKNLYAMNIVIEKVENISDTLNTPAQSTALYECLERLDQSPSMALLLIKAGANLGTKPEELIDFLVDHVKLEIRINYLKMLIAERKSVGLDNVVALRAAQKLTLLTEIQDIVFDGLECTPEQIHALKNENPLAKQVLLDYENTQQVLLERELRGTLLEDRDTHPHSTAEKIVQALSYARSLIFPSHVLTEKREEKDKTITVKERLVPMPINVLQIIHAYLGHEIEQ